MHGFVLYRTLQWTYYLGYNTSTGDPVASSQPNARFCLYTPASPRYSRLYRRSCHSCRGTYKTTHSLTVPELWGIFLSPRTSYNGTTVETRFYHSNLPSQCTIVERISQVHDGEASIDDRSGDDGHLLGKTFRDLGETHLGEAGSHFRNCGHCVGF